jgi:hypothetical protein
MRPLLFVSFPSVCFSAAAHSRLTSSVRELVLSHQLQTENNHKELHSGDYPYSYNPSQERAQSLQLSCKSSHDALQYVRILYAIVERNQRKKKKKIVNAPYANPLRTTFRQSRSSNPSPPGLEETIIRLDIALAVAARVHENAASLWANQGNTESLKMPTRRIMLCARIPCSYADASGRSRKSWKEVWTTGCAQVGDWSSGISSC